MPTPEPTLADRYGRPRRAGRVAVVLGAGVCLVLVVVVVLVARWWLDTPVRSGIVGFTDTTEDSITVIFDVRRDPGVPVTCVVELTTLTRLDTRQELELPAGPETELRVTHTFRSTQPVAAKLIGCRAPGQRRLA